jgi:hypothetical protein
VLILAEPARWRVEDLGGSLSWSEESWGLGAGVWVFEVGSGEFLGFGEGLFFRLFGACARGGCELLLG